MSMSSRGGPANSARRRQPTRTSFESSESGSCAGSDCINNFTESSSRQFSSGLSEDSSSLLGTTSTDKVKRKKRRKLLSSEVPTTPDKLTKVSKRPDFGHHLKKRIDNLHQKTKLNDNRIPRVVLSRLILDGHLTQPKIAQNKVEKTLEPKPRVEQQNEFTQENKINQKDKPTGQKKVTRSAPEQSNHEVQPLKGNQKAVNQDKKNVQKEETQKRVSRTANEKNDSCIEHAEQSDKLSVLKITDSKLVHEKKDDKKSETPVQKKDAASADESRFGPASPTKNLKGIVGQKTKEPLLKVAQENKSDQKEESLAQKKIDGKTEKLSHDTSFQSKNLKKNAERTAENEVTEAISQKRLSRIADQKTEKQSSNRETKDEGKKKNHESFIKHAFDVSKKIVEVRVPKLTDDKSPFVNLQLKITPQNKVIQKTDSSSENIDIESRLSQPQKEKEPNKLRDFRHSKPKLLQESTGQISKKQIKDTKQKLVLENKGKETNEKLNKPADDQRKLIQNKNDHSREEKSKLKDDHLKDQSKPMRNEKKENEIRNSSVKHELDQLSQPKLLQEKVDECLLLPSGIKLPANLDPKVFLVKVKVDKKLTENLLKENRKSQQQSEICSGENSQKSDCSKVVVSDFNKCLEKQTGELLSCDLACDVDPKKLTKNQIVTTSGKKISGSSVDKVNNKLREKSIESSLKPTPKVLSSVVVCENQLESSKSLSNTKLKNLRSENLDKRNADLVEDKPKCVKSSIDKRDHSTKDILLKDVRKSLRNSEKGLEKVLSDSNVKKKHSEVSVDCTDKIVNEQLKSHESKFVPVDDHTSIRTLNDKNSDKHKKVCIESNSTTSTQQKPEKVIEKLDVPNDPFIEVSSRRLMLRKAAAKNVDTQDNLEKNSTDVDKSFKEESKKISKKTNEKIDKCSKNETENNKRIIKKLDNKKDKPLDKTVNFVENILEINAADSEKAIKNSDKRTEKETDTRFTRSKDTDIKIHTENAHEKPNCTQKIDENLQNWSQNIDNLKQSSSRNVDRPRRNLSSNRSTESLAKDHNETTLNLTAENKTTDKEIKNVVSSDSKMDDKSVNTSESKKVDPKLDSTIDKCFESSQDSNRKVELRRTRRLSGRLGDNHDTCQILNVDKIIKVAETPSEMKNTEKCKKVDDERIVTASKDSLELTDKKLSKIVAKESKREAEFTRSKRLSEKRVDNHESSEVCIDVELIEPKISEKPKKTLEVKKVDSNNQKTSTENKEQEKGKIESRRPSRLSDRRGDSHVSCNITSNDPEISEKSNKTSEMEKVDPKGGSIASRSTVANKETSKIDSKRLTRLSERKAVSRESSEVTSNELEHLEKSKRSSEAEQVEPKLDSIAQKISMPTKDSSELAKEDPSKVESKRHTRLSERKSENHVSSNLISSESNISDKSRKTEMEKVEPKLDSNAPKTSAATKDSLMSVEQKQDKTESRRPTRLSERKADGNESSDDPKISEKSMKTSEPEKIESKVDSPVQKTSEVDKDSVELAREEPSKVESKRLTRLSERKADNHDNSEVTTVELSLSENSKKTSDAEKVELILNSFAPKNSVANDKISKMETKRPTRLSERKAIAHESSDITSTEPKLSEKSNKSLDTEKIESKLDDVSQKTSISTKEDSSKIESKRPTRLLERKDENNESSNETSTESEISEKSKKTLESEKAEPKLDSTALKSSAVIEELDKVESEKPTRYDSSSIKSTEPLLSDKSKKSSEVKEVEPKLDSTTQMTSAAKRDSEPSKIESKRPTRLSERKDDSHDNSEVCNDVESSEQKSSEKHKVKDLESRIAQKSFEMNKNSFDLAEQEVDKIESKRRRRLSDRRSDNHDSSVVCNDVESKESEISEKPKKTSEAKSVEPKIDSISHKSSETSKDPSKIAEEPSKIEFRTRGRLSEKRADCYGSTEVYNFDLEMKNIASSESKIEGEKIELKVASTVQKSSTVSNEKRLRRLSDKRGDTDPEFIQSLDKMIIDNFVSDLKFKPKRSRRLSERRGDSSDTPESSNVSSPQNFVKNIIENFGKKFDENAKSSTPTRVRRKSLSDIKAKSFEDDLFSNKVGKNENEVFKKARGRPRKIQTQNQVESISGSDSSKVVEQSETEDLVLTLDDKDNSESLLSEEAKSTDEDQTNAQSASDLEKVDDAIEKPVPKKRGRKPKNLSLVEKVDDVAVSIVVKKPRGRPRILSPEKSQTKLNDLNKTEDTDKTVVRKRGRSPRIFEFEKFSDESESELVIDEDAHKKKIAKRRGRESPRIFDFAKLAGEDETVDELKETTETVVVKKRGRPKLSDSKKPTDHSETAQNLSTNEPKKADEDSSVVKKPESVEEPTDKVETTPKSTTGEAANSTETIVVKKRGRPKLISPEKSSEVKKPRGRPRLSNPEQSTSMVVKKRGRPRMKSAEGIETQQNTSACDSKKVDDGTETTAETKSLCKPILLDSEKSSAVKKPRGRPKKDSRSLSPRKCVRFNLGDESTEDSVNDKSKDISEETESVTKENQTESFKKVARRASLDKSDGDAENSTPASPDSLNTEFSGIFKRDTRKLSTDSSSEKLSEGTAESNVQCVQSLIEEAFSTNSAEKDDGGLQMIDKFKESHSEIDLLETSNNKVSPKSSSVDAVEKTKVKQHEKISENDFQINLNLATEFIESQAESGNFHENNQVCLDSLITSEGNENLPEVENISDVIEYLIENNELSSQISVGAGDKDQSLFSPPDFEKQQQPTAAKSSQDDDSSLANHVTVPTDKSSEDSIPPAEKVVQKEASVVADKMSDDVSKTADPAVSVFDQALVTEMVNELLPQNQSSKTPVVNQLETGNKITLECSAPEIISDKSNSLGPSSESAPTLGNQSIDIPCDEETFRNRMRHEKTIIELKKKIEEKLGRKFASKVERLDKDLTAPDELIDHTPEHENYPESLCGSIDSEENLADRLHRLNNPEVPPMSSFDSSDSGFQVTPDEQRPADNKIVLKCAKYTSYVDVINTDAEISCGHCDESFVSNRDLRKHERSQHRGNIVIKIKKTEENKHKVVMKSKEEQRLQQENSEEDDDDDDFSPDGEIKMKIVKSGLKSVVKELKITPRSDGSNRVPNFSPVTMELISSPSQPLPKKRGRPRKYPIFTEAELIAKRLAAEQGFGPPDITNLPSTSFDKPRTSGSENNRTLASIVEEAVCDDVDETEISLKDTEPLLTDSDVSHTDSEHLFGRSSVDSDILGESSLKRKRLRTLSQGSVDSTISDVFPRDKRPRLGENDGDESNIFHDKYRITKELVVHLTKIDKVPNRNKRMIRRRVPFDEYDCSVSRNQPIFPPTYEKLPHESAPLKSSTPETTHTRAVTFANSIDENQKAKILMLKKPNEPTGSPQPSAQPQFCILFIPDAMYSNPNMPKDATPTATIVNFQPVPDSEIHNRPMTFTPTTPTKMSVPGEHSKPFVCANCTKVLDIVGKLEANMGGMAEESGIKCPLCTNNFQSTYYLEYHLMQEHHKCENEKQCKHSGSKNLRMSSNVDASTEFEVYITFALKCRSCYDIFGTVSELNDHVMQRHKTLVRLKSTGLSPTKSPPGMPGTLPGFPGKNGSRMAFQCPSDCICRVGIRSNTTLTQRQQMIRRCPNAMRYLEEIKPAAYEVYTCILCKTTFLEKNEVVDHLMKMHEVSCKFPCKTCLTSFRTVQMQNKKRHGCIETTLQDLDKMLTIAILPTNATGKGGHIKYPLRDDSMTEEYDMKSPESVTNIVDAGLKNGYKRKLNGAFDNCVVPAKKPKPANQIPFKARRKKRNKLCPKCAKRFSYRKSLFDHIIEDHIKNSDVDEEPKNRAIEVLKKWGKERSNIHCTEEFSELLDAFAVKDKEAWEKVLMMNDDDDDKPVVVQVTEEKKIRGMLKCSKCLEYFKKPPHLDKDNNRHCREGELLCGNCFNDGITTRRSSVLNGTSSSESSPVNPFACTKCSRTFPTLVELKNHKRDDHLAKSKDLTCGVCKKTFTSERFLEKHRKIHPEVANGQASTSASSNSVPMVSKESENHPLNCSICDKIFTSKIGLKNHLLEHGCRAFLCEICNRLLIGTSVVRHMLDYHIVPSKSNQHNASLLSSNSLMVDNFNEDSCSQEDVDELIRTLGKRRLQSLMMYHDFDIDKCNNEITKCPLCVENFATRESCRFHYIWMHDDTCILCDEQFASGNAASQHKLGAHNSTASYLWCIQRLVRAIVNTLGLHPDQPSQVHYQVLAMKLDHEMQLEAEIESMIARTAEKGADEVVPGERFLEEVLSEDQLPDSGNMIEVVIGKEDSEDDLLSLLNLSPTTYANRGSATEEHILPPATTVEEMDLDDSALVVPPTTSSVPPSPLVNVTSTSVISASSVASPATGTPGAPTENYVTSSVCKYNMQNDEEQLVLVITDEDLIAFKDDVESLADRISATCDSLTLDEITEMLKAYFESVNASNISTANAGNTGVMSVSAAANIGTGVMTADNNVSGIVSVNANHLNSAVVTSVNSVDNIGNTNSGVLAADNNVSGIVSVNSNHVNSAVITSVNSVNNISGNANISMSIETTNNVELQSVDNSNTGSGAMTADITVNIDTGKLATLNTSNTNTGSNVVISVDTTNNVVNTGTGGLQNVDTGNSEVLSVDTTNIVVNTGSNEVMNVDTTHNVVNTDTDGLPSLDNVINEVTNIGTTIKINTATDGLPSLDYDEDMSVDTPVSLNTATDGLPSLDSIENDQAMSVDTPVSINTATNGLPSLDSIENDQAASLESTNITESPQFVNSEASVANLESASVDSNIIPPGAKTDGDQVA